jgi:hypothetical protein
MTYVTTLLRAYRECYKEEIFRFPPQLILRQFNIIGDCGVCADHIRGGIMIIEKLLPPTVESRVHDLMTAIQFPWYWNAENIVPETPDDAISQLTHMFYQDKRAPSPQWNSSVSLIVGHFVQKTNIRLKRIVRVKGNLIPNIAHKNENLDNLIHTDVPREWAGNYVSFVYYVMDSDGDTIIFADDKKTIVETSPPVKGNCVWFDSKLWHRSTVPVNNKRRVIINFILEVE